jgi:transaldolase
MNATRILHERGQSLWLDNITRTMCDNGWLQHFIDDFAVTGVVSNPSLFDKAIASGDYDDAIRAKPTELSDEELFFELAVEDVQCAADRLLPLHERTEGVDGWVSLEVSPLLAYDTAKTIEAAKALHARAGRRNLLIEIPGTIPGLPAITELVVSGVPVNATLLFSAGQYRLAAGAFLEGIERRVADGLDPAVGSVASVFVSRWDTVVADRAPNNLKGQLGRAMGLDIYRAYRRMMGSDRAQRLVNFGARKQRLLWASTGAGDASDTPYVHGLAAPLTISPLPDTTLRSFHDHGEVGDPMPADGGGCDAVLVRFADAGIDPEALASHIQNDRVRSSVDTWNGLMARISRQSTALA